MSGAPWAIATAISGGRRLTIWFWPISWRGLWRKWRAIWRARYRPAAWRCWPGSCPGRNPWCCRPTARTGFIWPRVATWPAGVAWCWRARLCGASTVRSTSTAGIHDPHPSAYHGRAPGRHRAFPGVEPGPRRRAAQPVRLACRPAFAPIPAFPGRAASGHGNGAAALFLARLDRAGAGGAVHRPARAAPGAPAVCWSRSSSPLSRR